MTRNELIALIEGETRLIDGNKPSQLGFRWIDATNNYSVYRGIGIRLGALCSYAHSRSGELIDIPVYRISFSGTPVAYARKSTIKASFGRACYVILDLGLYAPFFAEKACTRRIPKFILHDSDIANIGLQYCSFNEGLEYRIIDKNGPFYYDDWTNKDSYDYFKSTDFELQTTHFLEL